MTTAFKTLCAVAKIKPKAGEEYEVFVKRLTNKIHNATDPEWQSLGNDSAAQNWHNEAMEALAARKTARVAAGKAGEDEAAAVAAIPLPELEGYEPLAAEAEKVDAETGEVTAAVDKPAKAEKKAKKEKKAKPEKAPKASKKKGAGESRGRPGSFTPEAKITVLAKENPKRKGSNAEKLFKLYKTGQTVAEALKLGVRWRDLRWDAKEKFISVK